MNSVDDVISASDFVVDVDDDVSFCRLDNQLVAYHQPSGDTHLLEDAAVWLVTLLLKGSLTENQLHQFYDERDDCLQFPLSRLIMSLEYTGIIRVRDADSRFATG